MAQSGIGWILSQGKIWAVPFHEAKPSEIGWNGTVQTLPSDNIPSIPRIKATQYLFYITELTYRSLSFDVFFKSITVWKITQTTDKQKSYSNNAQIGSQPFVQVLLCFSSGAAAPHRVPGRNKSAPKRVKRDPANFNFFQHFWGCLYPMGPFYGEIKQKIYILTCHDLLKVFKSTEIGHKMKIVAEIFIKQN